jgi:hypothetical protein
MFALAKIFPSGDIIFRDPILPGIPGRRPFHSNQPALHPRRTALWDRVWPGPGGLIHRRYRREFSDLPSSRAFAPSQIHDSPEFVLSFIPILGPEISRFLEIGSFYRLNLDRYTQLCFTVLF